MREGALETDAIAEVGMDGERRVFVRPAARDFEQVYRAAMDVYWDRSSGRLSHPRPPRGSVASIDSGSRRGRIWCAA